MKLQARIGFIFSLFALAVFGFHLAYYLDLTGSLAGFFELHRLKFLIYAMAMLATVIFPFPNLRMLQLALLFYEGLSSLSFQADIFAGFIMLVTAVFIMIAYGFFYKHKPTKIILISISIYILFVIYPFANASNKYITSAEWLGLLIAFMFISWAIFKDYIDKLQSEREVAIKAAMDAAKIAREAIELDKREIK